MAWARRNRPDLPPHLGPPDQWAANASAQGFPVDCVPAVGAIAVYQPASYGASRRSGSVAVVEATSGPAGCDQPSARIYISQGKRNLRWTGTVGVQFIHLRRYSTGRPAHPVAPTAPPSAAPPPTTPPPSPAPQVWVYQVANTCAGGTCPGLNERTGPSTTGTQVVATDPYGSNLPIVCQTTGSLVTGTIGGQSDIWDKLADGYYVSDLFVNTPGVGVFSNPPITQRC